MVFWQMYLHPLFIAPIYFTFAISPLHFTSPCPFSIFQFQNLSSGISLSSSTAACLRLLLYPSSVVNNSPCAHDYVCFPPTPTLMTPISLGQPGFTKKNSDGTPESPGPAFLFILPRSSPVHTFP